MHKILLFLLMIVNVSNSFSVEINYTLLNGHNGIIIVPDDVVEINAIKGDMNFVRNNGEIINLLTSSPMVSIIGIENLPLLNRLELSMQLHGDNMDFIKSSSIEYLYIDFITLNNMDFLQNLPNLKYLGLNSIQFNNNIMDLTNSQIQYFIVSHIRSTETIELLRNNYLEDFIVFYSDIIVNNELNLRIINNYNDFVNEPKYLRIFLW